MWSWLSRKYRPTRATSPASAPPPAPPCTWSNRSASSSTTRRLKRAGLDYWRQRATGIAGRTGRHFESQLPAGARLWLIESKGPRHYARGALRAGRLPGLRARDGRAARRRSSRNIPIRWLRIPMFDARVRSLNLSNCVALVLYEALAPARLCRRDLTRQALAANRNVRVRRGD